MTFNYYFDTDYWFVDSLPAGEGECPPNACRVPLPPKPWDENTHPKYDIDKKIWVMTVLETVPPPESQA